MTDTTLFSVLWREKNCQSPNREQMVGCIIVSFTTVYFISFFPTIPIIHKYIKYYYELKEIGDKEGNEHLRREDSVRQAPCWASWYMLAL